MIYILLLVGLALLTIGGSALVDGAVGVARRMGVSSLLIGLTLVGFGTSTPELTTSLIAAANGSGDIAVGNIVGSSTANILLILGVAALIYPFRIDIKSFRRDGLFLGISAIGIIAAAFIGQIGAILGGAFVAILIYYVYYSYKTDRLNQKEEKTAKEKTPVWIGLIKTIGGIALTIIGAKLLVDNAIILAELWGISEAVIGLTIVAVGTSLPELAVSVSAALKKESGVAFGNVVGSNIYNALFILGITALFLPVPVSGIMGKDIAIMSAATIALISIAFWRKRFSRATGLLFLTAYGVYVAYLF